MSAPEGSATVKRLPRPGSISPNRGRVGFRGYWLGAQIGRPWMVAQEKPVGQVLPVPQTMPQWSAAMPVVAITQRPVPGPANVQVESRAHAREQKPVASVGTALRQSQPLAHGTVAVHVWPSPQPAMPEPEQSPAVQTSLEVQPSPSLQSVLSGAAGFEQPEAGLHVPATWHWSEAVQVTPMQ